MNLTGGELGWSQVFMVTWPSWSGDIGLHTCDNGENK